MSDSDDFYKTLVDELNDGVYLVDRDRIITYWNQGAEAISGYDSERVLGRRCGDGLLTHVDTEGRALCGDGCPLAATMQDGQPREVEAFLHHENGHRVPVRIRASPIRDASGAIVGAVEVFDDNWRRRADRERIAELERIALLDSLTRLGNRRYAEMQLNSKIGELERFGRSFGVVFFDIDQFKHINDEHGHDAGDRVLRMVAHTAQVSVRSFDHVSRWAGDEFLGLIVYVDQSSLTRVAEKIRALVEASSLAARGHELRVTVSIGATLARNDDTIASLIGRADRLMYASKTAGGNRASVE
jgi:diguanylate cyclase (GGDEF)-like protein/PAS domain S-box-containing protein